MTTWVICCVRQHQGKTCCGMQFGGGVLVTVVVATMVAMVAAAAVANEKFVLRPAATPPHQFGTFLWAARVPLRTVQHRRQQC